MEPRQVVGAVHAAAEGVVQQRLYVDGSIPRRGQVKVNAEIVSGNAESGGGKGRRVDALALVMQALPVDLPVIRPRPQADVTELPQPDDAADEVLVGVQKQVQQMLVWRHGEKAVDLSGVEVGEEAVQLVVRVLGGVEQVAVQLDVKRAAVFRVGHFVRRRHLVRGRVGGQAVCKKLLMAGEKFAVWNQNVIVRADAVISHRVEAAAKLSLDHDRVQSRRAERLVEGCKLRCAHRLVQHLPDDLLFGHGKQSGVFLGSRRFAGSLEDNRQQLLLPRQRENGRPVHAFSGDFPAGNSSLGDMQKLSLRGSQGHVRVSSPFFVFFDGVSGKQRRSAEKRAQGVADHIIHLRHAEGITVLGILDSRAEHTADEHCEDDSAPTVPLSRQGVGKRQPQREEEEDVHQHLAVDLRLHSRGGQGGKGGEDQAGAALGAAE